MKIYFKIMVLFFLSINLVIGSVYAQNNSANAISTKENEDKINSEKKIVEKSEHQVFEKDSLYSVMKAWREQQKKAFDWSSLTGHPVVLTMTYTGCQYSCPMTIKALRELEKKFLEKGVQNIQFVIASFDPKYDTPVALAKYKKEKQMNPSWHFVTAPSDKEVRELAVLLGISYKRVGERDFSHSNAIALLDPQGKVVSQLEGLNADTKEFIEKGISYELPK